MIAKRLARAAILVSLGAVAMGPSCVRQPRAAVSLSIRRHHRTPADSMVTIDEEFIGPLGYVAAHGVRLPLGPHRITVEHEGFFPYDATVVAGSAPIHLDIDLTPIPD